VPPHEYPARYCTGYLGDIGVPLDDAPMISALGSKLISMAAGTGSSAVS
jgi:hypothetical protein